MGLVHRDPEFKVRLAVIKALRELRERVAVRSFVVLLQDGSPEIRADSVRGLIEIYVDTGRVDALGKIRQAFSDSEALPLIPPHVRVDPAVAPALALRLRDDEPKVRRLAAVALGALRARGTSAELVAALADPDSGVRAEIVTTIERTCGESEGRALIPLLSDESGEVRNRALGAVGRLRVREAGPALRQAYEAARGRDAVLRVLDALSRVGDPTQRDLFVAPHAGPRSGTPAIRGRGSRPHRRHERAAGAQEGLSTGAQRGSATRLQLRARRSLAIAPFSIPWS